MSWEVQGERLLQLETEGEGVPRDILLNVQLVDVRWELINRWDGGIAVYNINDPLICH